MLAAMRRRIDRSGRLVIPKPLRERYRFDPGVEIEIVTLPHGITLVPVVPQRRIVRRGRITALDSGVGTASTEIFSIDCVRNAYLEEKSGPSP